MPTTSPAARSAGKTSKRRKSSKPTAVNLSPELRHEMIEQAAYFRAERRGFHEGDPVADWLLSEQEVNMTLSKGAH
jgi:hypothetical protein